MFIIFLYFNISFIITFIFRFYYCITILYHFDLISENTIIRNNYKNKFRRRRDAKTFLKIANLIVTRNYCISKNWNIHKRRKNRFCVTYFFT